MKNKKHKHKKHEKINSKKTMERVGEMSEEAVNTSPLEKTADDQEGFEEVIEQKEVSVTVEELSEKIQSITKERDEYLDLAQRQKAEFVNYKRRTETIRKDSYDEGRRDTIEGILPIVDNLERALEAADENSPLREGVEMIYRQTKDVLDKMGVVAIDPAGGVFDANTMNAVMQGTEEEGEPGTVCQVLQKGYRLGEHVIRHAMVKVVAG